MKKQGNCRDCCKIIHNLMKNVKQPSLTRRCRSFKFTNWRKSWLTPLSQASYCLTFIVRAKMMQVLYRSRINDCNYRVNCMKHTAGSWLNKRKKKKRQNGTEISNRQLVSPSISNNLVCFPIETVSTISFFVSITVTTSVHLSQNEGYEETVNWSIWNYKLSMSIVQQWKFISNH